MKKSSRKPNRSALGVANRNELTVIHPKSLVEMNAQSEKIIAKKVEGQEMLLKVKRYEPVVIKGYKYAF